MLYVPHETYSRLRGNMANRITPKDRACLEAMQAWEAIDLCPSLTDLAIQARIPRATAQTCVNKLIKNGWVTKDGSKHCTLKLTPAGLEQCQVQP